MTILKELLKSLDEDENYNDFLKNLYKFYYEYMRDIYIERLHYFKNNNTPITTPSLEHYYTVKNQNFYHVNSDVISNEFFPYVNFTECIVWDKTIYKSKKRIEFDNCYFVRSYIDDISINGFCGGDTITFNNCFFIKNKPGPIIYDNVIEGGSIFFFANTLFYNNKAYNANKLLKIFKQIGLKITWE